MRADELPPQPPAAPCEGALAQGTGPFEPRMYQFGRVHCAVNYAMANCSMLQVDGGYVVFDTAPSLASAAAIKRAFEERVRGEPQAIVYTHSHADHTQGAAVFYRPGMEIWGQQQFGPYQIHEHLLTQAYVERAAKQFGYALDPSLVTTNGIGPPLRVSVGELPPLLFPTRTFADVAELRFGEIELQLHAAPGETADHLFAWLPGERVLLAGDNIYKAFPNLYAIRGVPPRPVDGWIRSLDAMRRLKPAPEYLVLGHTAPVEGAARIHQLLTDYRDAIAYVHDSVVRLINQGRTPDDLADQIRLPEHLAGHPYLQQVYGTVRSSVRGIYAGYMGWFNGRGAQLDPHHPRELARRLIPRLGGRSMILSLMREALDRGDPRWAAWLGQQLLAQDAKDAQAAELSSEALRQLGEMTENPLERHWYLSDALSLIGAYHPPRKPRITSAVVAALPIEHLLALLPSRVNPERAAGVEFALGLDFTDSGKRFTFFIRRGVGELAPALAPRPDLLLRTTEAEFKRAIVAREVTPLSPSFWKGITFEVDGQAGLKPLRVLRELSRFAACMLKP